MKNKICKIFNICSFRRRSKLFSCNLSNSKISYFVKLNTFLNGVMEENTLKFVLILIIGKEKAWKKFILENLLKLELVSLFLLVVKIWDNTHKLTHMFLLSFWNHKDMNINLEWMEIGDMLLSS
jgi:hypothetical protein